MIKSLEPGYATVMSHIYRPEELTSDVLVLQPKEVIVEQAPGFVRTVTLEEPKPRSLEVHTSLIDLDRNPANELLRLHGYHPVKEVWYSGSVIYARGWAWPVLKVTTVAGDCFWGAMRWAYRRRLIALACSEAVVPRIRDVRPRVFHWRKLRSFDA